MNKKPTIKTIAEIAGVSHVTVSRALRGSSDISKATTQKILKIAKEIGYTPNAFARSLSSRQSHTIGMIVPALGNDTAYSDVFNAISASAADQGLSVLLGSCGRDIELEKKFCKSMCENRVGALIISPISSNVSHIKEICKDIVPLIFIGGKTGCEEENCITIDYGHSAKLAVEHLYSLGHRDIALFLYHPTNKTIMQKLEGYNKTMEEYGLTPKVYWHGESSDTLNAGRALINRLVSSNSLPTAIWCASDYMAVGVLDVLKQHNIMVPEDISVMGHDNLFFSELNLISLTTFSLPKKSIGIKAVKIALDIMNYDEDACQNQPASKAVFRAELIPRGSTGTVKS
jgi:DNA-binding LacI/PurR family transcriptional regulator